MTQVNSPIQDIDPALLMSVNNTRYGLKAARLELLKTNILQEGRILVPLEVYPLTEPTEKGEQYAVKYGNYRREAALQLNRDNGAGIKCPCIVVDPPADGIADLRTVVAENFQRQDLTPMDTAIAIKELLAAGMSRIQVREVFSKPGGRKGAKVAPVSNSFINIMLSFLDLPKPAQTKLHNGQYGVTAGMELVKIQEKSPEKLKATMDKLDEEFESQLSQEDKWEEQYLEAQKKEELAKAKLVKLQEDADVAAKKLSETAKQIDELAKAEVEATHAARKADLDAETKKAAEERLKNAQGLTQAAIKNATAAKREKERLEAKIATARQTAEERKAKLEAERKAAAKGGKDKQKSQSAGDVAKAAKSVGVEQDNTVPLKLAEIREVVGELQAPACFPKVRLIGDALAKCFSGVTTERQLITELSKITGEKADKLAKAVVK